MRCCATVKGVYRTRKASFFFIVRCLVFFRVVCFVFIVGIQVCCCLFPGTCLNGRIRREAEKDMDGFAQQTA